MEEVLDITGLGRRGDGLATLVGRSVHVPFALPGEKVRAEVDGERARVMARLSDGPDRASPFCPHFGICGGCQMQHLAEAPYRQWKRGLVGEAFRHQKLMVEVAPLIDAHGEGRRRVSLHVRVKNGAVTAGFMEMRSHALVDIEACPILAPALAPIHGIACAMGAALGNCDLAATATETGLDIAVKAERPAERNLARAATLCTTLDLARLAINGETVAMLRAPQLAMGRARVSPPPQFFLQATAKGEEELSRLVLDAAGKAKVIADLFCGCGPFALRLAERSRVDAIDSDRAAVVALGAAHRQTPGLKPIVTTARDLFREPLAAKELSPYDAVVFDPPRAGAEAQARQIAKSTVRDVIAVSCDPATLARDAAILIAGGYRLLALTPVDQFKWSFHLEAVAHFRKC
ncbi:MAG: class I SAM-dependent RNA methyltransferase [Alphaproteobacteria bacterium]|nr:class I SAM-dependent RNA methyltransferase [Alphaproteobacteria bacterium]